MRNRLLYLTALVPLLLSSAQASSMSMVTVDTSSLAGTDGFLDFTFDPGALVTQSAFAGISGFSSDGALGTPFVSGDVTGILPADVTLNNDQPFNDYFTEFTYGNTLSFLLTLGGPAIDSPDGTSTSGSTFAFSMFSADGATPLLTSNSTDGFAFTFDVNLDGSTRLANFSDATSVGGGPSSAVPEPASFLLCGASLIALFVKARAARRAATGRPKVASD